MKIKIGFVTNSSSCSYLVLSGSLSRPLPQLEEFKKKLQDALVEEGYDRYFVENSDYVTIEDSYNLENGVRIPSIAFSIASGIPYATSIKQEEERAQKLIEELGYNLTGKISGDVEERWE